MKMKNALRAIAAVSRCAPNGDTLKQSYKRLFAWKQVRTRSGKHWMETTWDVPPVVENLLKYFSSSEMQGKFSYGCKAVLLCEDKTKCPKHQVDWAFLDKEFVNAWFIFIKTLWHQ
jgi:hypothetical protein